MSKGAFPLLVVALAAVVFVVLVATLFGLQGSLRTAVVVSQSVLPASGQEFGSQIRAHMGIPSKP